MDHADIRKRVSEGVFRTFAEEEFTQALRGYQRETLTSLAAWLSDPSGSRRGYVAHATGLGKTVVIGALVRIAAGLRVLVVVPTKVLVEQTARALHPYVGGLLGHWSSLKTICEEDGERIAIRGLEDAPLVVTTEASLVKTAGDIARDFGPHLVVWDECHRSYGAPAQAALRAFPEAVVVGCTATPDYLLVTPYPGSCPVEFDDGTVLFAPPDRMARAHYPTCIDRRSLRWGVTEGWLARPQWGIVDATVPLGDIPITSGKDGLDYDGRAVDLRVAKHWPALRRLSVELLLRDEFRGRRAYALCPSVVAARELAACAEQAGLPAKTVTATTGDGERRKILRSFREGRLPLVTSVGVLREGWNDPEADTCLVLSPTASAVNYLQPMGRVLRKSEQGRDKRPLVVDVFRHHERLPPFAEPLTYGRPLPKALRGSRHGFVGSRPRTSGPELNETLAAFSLQTTDALEEAMRRRGKPISSERPAWFERVVWEIRINVEKRNDGAELIHGPVRKLVQSLQLDQGVVVHRIGVLQRLGILGYGNAYGTLEFFDPEYERRREAEFAKAPARPIWRGTHASWDGRDWATIQDIAHLIGAEGIDVLRLFGGKSVPIRMLEPRGREPGTYFDIRLALEAMGATAEAIARLLPAG